MILGTKRNESTNQTPQAGEPRPPADTHTAHTDTAQDGSNACHSAPPGFNGRRRTKKEMKERKRKATFLGTSSDILFSIIYICL